MPGFFKFDERAALEFADMCEGFNNARSRAKRVRMAAWCLSQVYVRENEVPYFTAGYRQIARACDVTDHMAREFLRCGERDGWIVNLGTVKRQSGVFQRRTFSWLIDWGTRAENTPSFRSPHGTPRDETTHSFRSPYAVTRPVSAHPRAETTHSFRSHQNTEYSDRARALHSHYAPAPREVEPRPVAPPIEDGAMPWE